MTAAANATVSLTRCQYCEHGNPGDSKYCNNCGATLTLAPCPHCGAVNQVTALACYQCRGALPASLTAALVPASSATEIAPPSSRRNARTLFAGAAVLAAVAAFGYIAYFPGPQVDVPAPTAASIDAGGRSGTVGPGAIGQDGASVVAKPAPDPGVDLTVVAKPPPEPPSVAAAVRAPANQRRAGRQPVEFPDAAKATGPGQPRAGPCTEAVAALGLCTLKPAARREVEAAAVGAARPQPAGAAKGSEREPSRQEPCTDAVAALGLCTLKPIPRRE